MAKWSDFYPLVKINLPGCPESVVDNAIKTACIDFCNRSLVWQQAVEAGSIIKGERTYNFNFGGNEYVIAAPLVLIINDRTITPPRQIPVSKSNRMDLDKFTPNWRTIESEYPSGYFMENASALVLVGTPTKNIPNGLHLLCAVKPKRTATTLPDFIYETWADTIADGALAILYAMTGKIWARPELVTHHARKFRASISRAKSKAYKSWVPQSLTATQAHK